MLKIFGALSDEQRIRILEILPGKPLRFTEVMRRLELEVPMDSSRFAYYMKVFCGAGLVKKADDVEAFRSLHPSRVILRIGQITSTGRRLEE